MGRYVYTVDAVEPWEYKYGFATQCSNFGHYLRMHNDGCVSLYRGRDGEYVKVQGDKKEVLETVESALETLRELQTCTICNRRECIEYTIKMFEDFKKYIENLDDKVEVDILLFSEYW